MIIKDKYKPVPNEMGIPELHGECTIEYIKDGKIIESITHKNSETPWIANATSKGDFYSSISTNKKVPLNKWFMGLMLLDKNADADSMMIPSDAKVIACANNAAGSDSTDLRRGNYNPENSGPVIDNDGRAIGYEHVWNFSDTRGNSSGAKIKAVCLTRPALAIARYDDVLPPDTVLNESLGVLTVGETLANCQIIDYEDECAYCVSVANQTISVKKYQVDTKQFRIVGVYNSSGILDVTKLIAEKDNIIPQVGMDYSSKRASVSFADHKIHLFTWVHNGSGVTDHIIDVSSSNSSDWTVTTNSYSYSDHGLNIKDLDINNNIIYPVKDGILYRQEEGYIWLVGTNNKFYKCSLTQASDVTAYNMPAYSYYNNGCFVDLPNGDWIKYSFGQDNVDRISVNFYHNGTVYAAYDFYNAPLGWGTKYYAINYTGYGTMLMSQPRAGRYGDEHYMTIVAPVNHISTVWNIDDDEHEKSADLTMRVTYRITETVS